jgi:hypothetical protein
VPTINHLVESGSEKIVSRHQNFLQFLSGFYGHYFNSSGMLGGNFPLKIFCLHAFQDFCRADCVSPPRSPAAKNPIPGNALRLLFSRQQSGQFICYKTGQFYLLPTQSCVTDNKDFAPKN